VIAVAINSVLLNLFQNPPTPGQWFTAPAIVAAAVTSVFTIAGIALKDFLFKTLEERRTEQRARDAIYERYSTPLINSTIPLMNRLNEILYEKHRPVYLRGEGINNSTNPGGAFRSYKKLSTIYRLAAVLGWIRACRREFSYLRVAEPGDAAQVEEAIEDFEDALANGQWVEQERVRRLCDLWHLCSPEKLNDRGDVSELGVRVDNQIWDHLEAAKRDDVSLLDEASRKTLSRKIAECISSHLETNAVSEEAIERSWPDAINIIGMREAWLYRDWQSAIGDAMIQLSGTDTRKFEVIGFGEFEKMVFEGNREQKIAFDRILAVFDDLNLSIEDRFDARPRQLRSIANASSKLILAIHEVQGKRSVISERVINIAKRIVEISSEGA
jgi:hypothetical protein